MNETDIRLLHLSHYPDQVRRAAHQTPYQAATSARDGGAANGRSLRSWAVGVAVSLVAAFSLVQVL